MDDLRHEGSAMAVANTNPPAMREREIGPTGTTTRILVGALLLGSVAQGHLARGSTSPPGHSGLSAWPRPQPGVFLVLCLLEPTSDAALIFYGASMWLAALRGCAGCEVLAVSNWLLGRDGQVSCAVFWPVDQAAADQARFAGSPTVRVDGHDVAPGSEPATEYILGCRLYRLEHRFAGQPEERWVREALPRAAGRS